MFSVECTFGSITAVLKFLYTPDTLLTDTQLVTSNVNHIKPIQLRTNERGERAGLK